MDPVVAEAAPRRSLLARLKTAFRQRNATTAKAAVSAGPAELSAFDAGTVGKSAAIAYIDAADNDPGRDGLAASGTSDRGRPVPRRLTAARSIAHSKVSFMFRWFETRLDPFPAEEPVEPPKTLLAFCLHYSRGAWPYIAIAAVFNTAIALAEVGMFGFLGRIVDWLSAQNRETFLQTEGLEACRHGLRGPGGVAGRGVHQLACCISRR